MTATLREILLEPGKRPSVIQDCVQLIDDEVRSKSGLSGIAVKGGYAMVKKIKPGIIAEAVDNMLDEFVARLEPFYAEYLDGPEEAIEPFFTRRDQKIANALLGVTDARAARTRHRTIKKAYEKLRPTGIKHTAAAVPGLARLIARHT
jgi:hypothetical protein